MNMFYAVLRSHWVRTLFGVLLLVALIWLFGPLIGIGQVHPFDSELARLAAIGVLLALWVIVNLLTMLKARKHEKQLVDQVVAAEPDPEHRGLGRGGGAAGRAPQGRPAQAEEGAGRPARPPPAVPAAVVPVHRPARRRQDHGAAQLPG